MLRSVIAGSSERQARSDVLPLVFVEAATCVAADFDAQLVDVGPEDVFPKAHQMISARRDECRAVGAPSDAADCSALCLQWITERYSAFHVPKSYRPVGRRGGEQTTVWTEGDAVNGACMTAQSRSF